MKWCRVAVDGRASFAILEGDDLILVDGSPFDSSRRTAQRHKLSAADLLIPIVPSNFYAVGVNYTAHIEWANARHKMNIPVPKNADIGYRSPNALIPSGAPIVIPKDSPGPLEYEAELVAVVGKKAKNLSEYEALSCLLGYTLGNDVSERGWQIADRTLWRAKNADSFKPMGPVIETELDPMHQRVSVRVNGAPANAYDTDKMIFSIRHYIARMTRYLTLHPGDVIWLGTDGACEPALKPGDRVEISVDAIGTLANPVIQEAV
jgi:2-keto-4-pentenoate hydratase/2-oxohepta-3-ene-1,7-dioic acid hydratase in catechol pathway